MYLFIVFFEEQVARIFSPYQPGTRKRHSTSPNNWGFVTHLHVFGRLGRVQSSFAT